MIIANLRRHYREAKAELQGLAVSKARRIKPLVEVSTVEPSTTGPAKPTHMAVRMMDGDPMVYHTDGSLRHAFGKKPGKAARKALKRMRRTHEVLPGDGRAPR